MANRSQPSRDGRDRLSQKLLVLDVGVMGTQKCSAGPKLYKSILRRAEHALADRHVTVAIG